MAMVQGLGGATDARRKRRIRWSVGVLALGGVVALVSLAVLIAVGIQLFQAENDAPLLHAPGTTTVRLEAGSYIVYEQVPSSGRSSTRLSGTVQVTAADGTKVFVGRPDERDTITRHGVSFASFAEFEPPTAGEYDVRVLGETSRSMVYLPSQDSEEITAGLSFLAMLVGGGIAVVGIGLVIWAVRTPKPQDPGFFPPGWYPAGPGGLRYWDGWRWL